MYTKSRHAEKIKKFLKTRQIDFEIFTTKDDPTESFETSYYDGKQFDLGISYCYPRKISEPLLSTPKQGFVNYHPAPLPKYKGPTELDEAIKNKEINWGVTLHQMDESYDTGKIIKMKEITLHEPPISKQELGAISHYFLFILFKETIDDLLKSI